MRRLQAGDRQERLGKLARGAGTAKLAPSAKVLAQADALDRKQAGGFPPAAKQLGRLEAMAAKTGKSPRAFKHAPSTQTAQLLTVLVEFSPSHYNKLIYTKTGLTQRVRPDLTGPDGRPGIDLRGYTVKNHYREMSKGAYDITAASPAGCRCHTPRPGTGRRAVARRSRTTPATS